MSKLTLRERALMSGSGVCVMSFPMLKGVLFSISLAALVLGAGAQPVPAGVGGACPQGEGEAACMLDAIWTAAEVLPEEKRERVEGDFIEIVDLTATDATSKAWRARLDNWTTKIVPSEPYATRKANEVIREEGWDAFFAKAKAREAPFKFGRPEIMAAGAEYALRDGDAEMAGKVLDEMFRLAGRGQTISAYERGDFGHMIAEIATKACDAELFDRGVEMSVEPASLRYALWRARLTGHAGSLAPRILQEATDEDTRHVRQVIEGYRPVLQFGYCKTDEHPIEVTPQTPIEDIVAAQLSD